MSTGTRAIGRGEILHGELVDLRLVTPDDCTPRYLGWLQDPAVNRYLETRWKPQTLESIAAFVGGLQSDPNNYLFAIVRRDRADHVGNLKVGPVVREHARADISYFIGEPSAWGQGLASEAIALATRWAFTGLGLRLLEAGLYRGNIGSARALEKCGYQLACVFPARLRGPEGFEDHLWYQRLNPDWVDQPG
jgi:RimJ/RimL family protein N-acetyltransferase